MRFCTIALLVLCSCGRLSSHFAGDGGNDGGSMGSDGGSSSQGGDSGSFGNGPGTDAGSWTPTDAGFVWSDMLPMNAFEYYSLGGTGSGSSVVLYAGETARIWRYQNGVWTNAWTEPQGFVPSVNSIWVSSDEAVFAAAGTTEMLSCLGNCTTTAAYTHVQLPGDMTGVCGTDKQHVYAVGNNGSTGVFFRFDAGTGGWDQLSQDTGTSGNSACWAAPTGEVYIAAQSHILRYDGALTAETMQWPSTWTGGDVTNEFLFGVGGDGSGGVWAVGSGKRILRRSAGGTWSIVLDPGDATDQMRAIAFGGGGSGLAGGFGGNNAPFAYIPSGASWLADPGASIDIFAIYAASPNEYYVAGEQPGGVGIGAVFRAKR